MRIVFILMSVLLLSVNCGHDKDRPFKVMTFNIRYGLADDGLDSWRFRKSNVANMVKKHKPDIVGLQEALLFQIEYLDSLLIDYTWIGAGRDDGKRSGEFTPILYDSMRFRMLRNETFWLSENPQKPGLGWDGAYIRTVTWTEFLDTKSNKSFFYFNTHFDNEGKQARLESAHLLKQKIYDIIKNQTFILSGDFNCEPGSPPYNYLSSKNTPPLMQFYDTQIISKTRHQGPEGTFTGFDIKAHPKAPIDYIFTGKDIDVLSHRTLADSDNGRLPSDHYPVVVALVLN